MARTTLDNLIALTIPEIQDIFLSVMQDIVDRAMLDEMIKAIEAGDAEALFKATGFTVAALTPILDAVEQLYQDTGNLTADGLPNRIRTPLGGSIIFRFNMRNPAVEEDLRTYSSALISRLTEEARDNVRIALQRGMIAGDNPRKTALNIVGRVDPVTKKRIGGILGLTTKQEEWVSNAERYLKDLDSKYFNLSLRDKRFDAKVRKSFEAGKPLNEETRQKIVTLYKNRALKFRADAIARTETIQSVNRSTYQTYKQLLAEGIDKSAITKVWDDVGDGKTRPSHFAMGRTYGKKGIPVDQEFVSPTGARLMYPGDRTLGAPASEIVNCRCLLRYKINFLAGVD